MSRYRTCFNCAVDRGTCQTRANLRKQLAGLHITSIAFKCEDRKPLFSPGDRVSVTWKVFPEGWSYEEGYSLESWPATVSGEAAGKYVIKIDDVDSDCETPARSYIKNANLFCKVSASKLEKLDEPSRPVCARCGEIGSDDIPGCIDLNGDGAFPAWAKTHPDCLRAQRLEADLATEGNPS